MDNLPKYLFRKSSDRLAWVPQTLVTKEPLKKTSQKPTNDIETDFEIEFDMNF